MDFTYTLLKENKVHIYGLTAEEVQWAEQYLKGRRAIYCRLGTDLFIYSIALSGLEYHLKTEHEKRRNS